MSDQSSRILKCKITGISPLKFDCRFIGGQQFENINELDFSNLESLKPSTIDNEMFFVFEKSGRCFRGARSSLRCK